MDLKTYLAKFLNVNALSINILGPRRGFDLNSFGKKKSQNDDVLN